MFYWSHSTLHLPAFYWIHKKHHEYTRTVSIAAVYAHPIEYMFGNLLPSGMGVVLLLPFTTVHFVTFMCWLVYRVFEAVDGHCGYDWTWGQLSFFPWRLRPEYHDFHHSHNCGNYGSMFWFWDALMGTNK